MSWIEPLELETWIVSVFSGTPEIFTAIALLVIMGMAGYFRMTGVTMFFMIAVFLFMFTEVIPFSLLTLVAIFGGLMIGYVMSNITQR